MLPLTAAETVAELGERALVERITARLTQPRWVVIGPGDDAAVVEPVPRTLDVLTTDALVESVHFDSRFTPAEAIGHRALAANLSDLAAMGARPRAALLSLILPGHYPVRAVDDLISGMVALAARTGVAVVGGNITSSPATMVVDVAVTGTVHRRRVLARRGARVGDDVYVSGAIGGAAVGLRSLQRQLATASRQTEHDGAGTHRYLYPEPRLRLGALLSDLKAASSCIDLSDGLADGVRRIAEASGVGMTLFGDAIPIDPSAGRWHDGDIRAMLDTALRGGDDYELLFTCSPRWKGRLRGVQRFLGDLPITRIGTVTRSPELVIRTATGSEPVPHGFTHFA